MGKFLILTKKHLVTAGCLLLAVIIGTAISVHAFATSDRLLPIYCVKTEEKKIAITFDAAWGADDTDTLISILKQKGGHRQCFYILRSQCGLFL